MPAQRVPTDRSYPPDQIERARHLADLVHAGQYDKGGRPYIEHPARVAAYVQITSRWCGLDATEQYVATVAAWLHDVIEDSRKHSRPVTAEDLLARGFSFRVVDVVILLTRPEERGPEQDEAYYAGILQSPVARAAKWADMIDNTDPNRLAQLQPSRQTYLIEKYDKGAACLKISPSPSQWWKAQSLKASMAAPDSLMRDLL